MKKVLLVITSGHFGGAQRYVFELARRLPAFGWHPTVLCGGGEQLVSMLRQKDQSDIEVIELPSLVREISPLNDLATLQVIRHLITSRQFDLVHANSSKAGLLARLAAWMKGCPSVFTAHGFVLSEPLSRPKKVLYWLLERVGASVSDKIIAVSAHDRKLALKYRLCGPTKIVSIHNGIDLEQYQVTLSGTDRSCLRESLGIQKKNCLLGTVANFYPSKGHYILLSALSELQRQGHDFECVLVGNGMLQSKTIAQAEQLALSDKVHFLAWRDDVPQILAALDLFVLPSVKEGFPFAILEAMATGLPIVATDVGGIAEVISNGKNGLLVPPSRADLLATAISSLILDPKKRHELGKAAQESVPAVERMVALTVKQYNHICSQSLV